MDSEVGLVHGALDTASAHLRGDVAEYTTGPEQLKKRSDAASWGDGGLLRPLVTAYSECTAIALAAYTRMGDLVGSTGDALALSSRRYSAAEEAAVHNVGPLPDTSWG